MDQVELDNWLAGKNNQYRRQDTPPKARPFLALADLSVELQSPIGFKATISTRFFCS